MKLRSRGFSPVLIGTLLSILFVREVIKPVSAQELLPDPDFVKTWDDPLPAPPSPTVTAPTSSVPTTKATPRTTVNTAPSITDADRQAVAKINTQQQQLLSNLRDSQQQQQEINSLAEDSKQKFEALRAVNTSLKQELLAMDEQQRQVTHTIAQISQQIDKLNEQLDVTTNRLLLKGQEVERQKNAVVSFVQAIYDRDNTSVLEVLLSSRTFADTLDEINHMQSLETAGQSLLNQLQVAEAELASEQASLQQKKENIDRLHAQLTKEQQILEVQQQSQRFLLDKTQGKEDEYQAMLNQFRIQAEQVEADIQALSADIAELKTASGLAALESQFGDRYALTNPQNGAIWPVDASYKGISAYFRDSGYQKLFGFPHSAIDIPAPAETPIRAPANGVVIKVVDNDGGSYNYLVVYHGTDNEGHDITTVYGHLPKVFVQKGDIVRRGDIIALTGGAPGTRGTGPYYTGPHLHFEVRSNGVAIDPLSWLP